MKLSGLVIPILSGLSVIIISSIDGYGYLAIASVCFVLSVAFFILEEIQ